MTKGLLSPIASPAAGFGSPTRVPVASSESPKSPHRRLVQAPSPISPLQSSRSAEKALSPIRLPSCRSPISAAASVPDFVPSLQMPDSGGANPGQPTKNVLQTSSSWTPRRFAGHEGPRSTSSGDSRGNTAPVPSRRATKPLEPGLRVVNPSSAPGSAKLPAFRSGPLTPSTPYSPQSCMRNTKVRFARTPSLGSGEGRGGAQQLSDSMNKSDPTLPRFLSGDPDPVELEQSPSRAACVPWASGAGRPVALRRRHSFGNIPKGVEDVIRL